MANTLENQKYSHKVILLTDIIRSSYYKLFYSIREKLRRLFSFEEITQQPSGKQTSLMFVSSSSPSFLPTHVPPSPVPILKWSNHDHKDWEEYLRYPRLHGHLFPSWWFLVLLGDHWGLSRLNFFSPFIQRKIEGGTELVGEKAERVFSFIIKCPL